MKRGKKYFALSILLSFVFYNLFSTGLVMAASTDTVTATVTAQSISVSVEDNSIAFGTVTTSSTKDTTTAGVNDSQTATNDGNITLDFNIKSTDSTNWALAAAAGSEQYTLKFCVTTCDTSPTWTSVGVHPAYATLAQDITASGTQVFDLQVGTPTSTASYGQQTITVTVQAALPS